MIGRILSLSVRMRWLVAVLTLVVIGFGLWQITKLPIDAVPDVTNRQVQISTFAPTLGPVDIEKQVTFPVETALAGIPGLEMTRSISRNGFSQVTAVFTDRTDIYFARQLVNERLGTVVLPQGIERPTLGPVSTGLGEVFHYVVSLRGWDFSQANEQERVEKLTYLRTIHDWIIRPKMRTVKGAAEINGWGGYECCWARTVLAALHDIDLVKRRFPETLLLARVPVAWGRTDEVLTAENLLKARRMCEAFDETAEACVAAA